MNIHCVYLYIGRIGGLFLGSGLACTVASDPPNFTTGPGSTTTTTTATGAPTDSDPATGGTMGSATQTTSPTTGTTGPTSGAATDSASTSSGGTMGPTSGSDDCGNGMVDEPEICDDGNQDDGDGCQADCTRTPILSFGPGKWHVCALFEGGNLKCWGMSWEGRLGYGDIDDIGDNESPSAVGFVDVGAPVKQVGGGEKHTCVVLESNEVKCWGDGEFGQHGYGHTNSLADDDNELPSTYGAVDLGGVAVSQLAVGFNHVCVAHEDGSVRCWGDNAAGQLGYGHTTVIGDNEVPGAVSAVNVGGNARAIAAGFTHSCAVLEDGSLVCWGDGADGKLGYGNLNTIGDDELPNAAGAVDVGGPVDHVVLGGTRTCAKLQDGTIRCWGSSYGGGIGTASDDIGDNEPASASPPINFNGTADRLTGSGNQFDCTCAHLTDGGVQCWGGNSSGCLGLGHTSSVSDPSAQPPINLGGPAAAVGTGDHFSCAALESWDVICWGSGLYGLLGRGNTTADIGDNEHPAEWGPIQLFDCPGCS